MKMIFCMLGLVDITKGDRIDEKERSPRMEPWATQRWGGWGEDEKPGKERLRKERGWWRREAKQETKVFWKLRKKIQGRSDRLH